MIDRIIILLFAIFLVAGTAIGLNHNKWTDEYVRNRVVLLKSDRGSCTGVEIRAPSKKVYTLTARHCESILTDKKVVATLEDGRKYTLTLVAIDKKSDLMLLEGIDQKIALDIADGYHKHEHVMTMTHGGGYTSYKTEGEILEEEDLRMSLGFVLDLADVKHCKANHGKLTVGGMFPLPMCVVPMHEMMVTAKSVPGSSGGPMLNDKLQVLGIVSVGAGDFFTGMVTIQDIKAFLKDK